MNFSVGICAYNEEQNIGKLLESILNHKTKHHLDEIIVVSSGCTDKTDEIVKEWAKKDNRVKLIREPERKGKYSAINLILSNNKSEILVMTDADCLIRENTIDFLLKYFKTPQVGVVCGRTVPINPQDGSFWGYIAHFRYRIFDEAARRDIKLNNYYHISGYLYALKKGIVKKIPPVLGDDTYIGLETARKGYKIAYSPEAVVNILHPTTFSDLIKQRKRIRLSHMEITKLTKVRIRNTLPVPVLLTAFKVMGKRPKEIFYTFIVGLFEQWAAFLAFLDFKRGKASWKTNWEEIKSSKKLK